MAATINPAVSGVRVSRWSLHVGIFVIAVAIGAAASYGATYAFFSIVSRLWGLQAWFAVAAAFVVACIARDIGLRSPVPYRNVQVPEWLRRILPPATAAGAYGVHLGIGFLTKFTNSTHLAFLALLPAARPGWLAIVPIGVFATSKAIVLVAGAGTGPFHEFEDTYYRRMKAPLRYLRMMRYANAAVATIAIGAVAASVV
jgi:hypothetical protein